MQFHKENVCWSLSVKQLRYILNIYCSYLAFQEVLYSIFRHTFLLNIRRLFHYFLSDSIETLYAGWKRVEIVCYEVSWGYDALIDIHNWLKLCQFFWPTWYVLLIYNVFSPSWLKVYSEISVIVLVVRVWKWISSWLKMIFWFHFHKLPYAPYRLSNVSIIAIQSFKTVAPIEKAGEMLKVW